MSVAEIARRARVSIATVSRALNNSPSVTKETTSLVQRIASELNYDPKLSRRGAKPGSRQKAHVDSIAVIVLGRQQDFWLRIPVFAAAVTGITRAARSRDTRVLIDQLVDGSDELKVTRDKSVRGAIVFVASTADVGLLRAVCEQLPVVRIMGDDVFEPDVDHIRADHLAIGQLAHRHLQAHGCNHFRFFTTRLDLQLIQLRAIGLAMACAYHDHESPTVFAAVRRPSGQGIPLKVKHASTIDGAVDALVSDLPRGTGLLVSQDGELPMLYASLMQRGIRPGRDLQILSCNNDPSALSMLPQRPATIDLNPSEMGRWAVTRLINRIARPKEPPVRILVPPRVIPAAEPVERPADSRR